MDQSPTSRLCTRRVFLAFAASAAAAPALGQGQAYASVTADITPIAELGDYARFVRANLNAALQQAFAGRTGIRGAPRLVVRIIAIQLSSNVDGGFSLDSGNSDFMTGEALVLDRNVVLRRHPQVVSAPAGPGGPYEEGGEQRRTAILCRNYAAWLARAI